MVVPDPLPLAYAVYAFINVDNCERPRSAINLHIGQPNTSNFLNILVAVNQWDQLLTQQLFISNAD